MYLKRMAKLFPDVIFHDVKNETSKLYVELETSTEWNEKAAMAFQTIILDRNPAGCGGPFNFTCEKKNKNYIVRWNCYNMAAY